MSEQKVMLWLKKKNSPPIGLNDDSSLLLLSFLEFDTDKFLDFYDMTSMETTTSDLFSKNNNNKRKKPDK